MTLVLLTVIASTPLRVVTMASPLPHIITDTPMGIEGVARVTVVVEMPLHQNHDAWPATERRLVDRCVLVGSH